MVKGVAFVKLQEGMGTEAVCKSWFPLSSLPQCALCSTIRLWGASESSPRWAVLDSHPTLQLSSTLTFIVSYSLSSYYFKHCFRHLGNHTDKDRPGPCLQEVYLGEMGYTHTHTHSEPLNKVISENDKKRIIG